ncbi:hypothetical protein A4X13_0g82 [Tilletia indica]|uniref:Uncharacterized protein n=1 Tax=Tilletia indica TaxID=43049 RepID=A0A177TXH6_9BASI|nr:hypothetical protein A4X13_0g82 [Tilletia indica]
MTVDDPTNTGNNDSPTPTPPQVILLESDGYSPMARPSNLPALHYKHALTHLLTEPSAAASSDESSRKKPKTAAERVEGHLKSHGWESTWRFGMYKHAHYHSTTHELLTVLTGTATLQLGGRKLPTSTSEDEPPISPSPSKQTINLEPGDILLLPAGYTHHALTNSDSPPFLLVGSYPEGSAPWDMKFPDNSTECDKVSDSIKDGVLTRSRKGLFDAKDPVGLVGEGGLEELWAVGRV